MTENKERQCVSWGQALTALGIVVTVLVAVAVSQQASMKSYMEQHEKQPHSDSVRQHELQPINESIKDLRGEMRQGFSELRRAIER